ncbi:MAG: nucleotidyltransferase domain-containing protein [Bacteroidales bacterium]|nr:nucleotidyltransferase domain-containing protein [Bacteroidales bacterium]MCF8337782.1 nucleotidyltransferase domain-containing protein [Bacteroidales bacterium]
MYKVVAELREREKELNCLYKVAEILSDENAELDKIFRHLVNVIPQGWQYPGVCNARIIFEDNTYTTPEFFETKWVQTANIFVDGNTLGRIDVYYSRSMDDGEPFLPEEQKLLNIIAEQISQYIFRRRLKNTVNYLRDKTGDSARILQVWEDEHWKWREEMARHLAETIDFLRYGIKGLYLIGSTKEATAGPASDLDLLCHFEGSEDQKRLLKEWIDGWSKNMAVVNYRNTGYNLEEGLIDLHIITDEDIAKKTSYASMIGSSFKSARLLKHL